MLLSIQLLYLHQNALSQECNLWWKTHKEYCGIIVFKELAVLRIDTEVGKKIEVLKLNSNFAVKNYFLLKMLIELLGILFSVTV